MRRFLIAFVFVLGVSGVAYIYGDPVSWHWCDLTDAAPSTRCVEGNMVVCANHTLPGHGFVIGSTPPKTARVVGTGPPPVVGTCRGTWAWWYSCNTTYPCQTECEICGLVSNSVTALDKDECLD